MAFPAHIVEISFDAPGVASPTWTAVTTYVRGLAGLDLFSTSRGRENELDQVDTGTVTVNLDNRDRRFDPANTSSPYYPNVVPMRRIRVRATWSSTTYDVFYGYIEDWGQTWTDPGTSNATCTIRAADAFKPLAVPRLGQTDPPADSYGEVVAFDNPDVYIPLTDPVGTTIVTPVEGSANDAVNTNGAGVFGAAGVVPFEGDTALTNSSPNLVGLKWTSGTNNLIDFGGQNQVGIEFWLKFTTSAAGILNLWWGRDAAVAQTQVELTSTTLTFSLDIGTPKTKTTTLATGNTYHVFCRYDGVTQAIYINGTSVSSGAQTGTLDANVNDDWILNSITTSGIVTMGHFALYKANLPSAARILAHYNAGALLGFASQASGARIGAILDAVGSAWPAGLRNIQTGVRTMQAVHQNGQAAVDEIRNTVTSEGKDSVFFAAKDGKLTFLQNTYRASSPYNTSQATFGDAGGAEIPYVDLELNYDDSHIYNHIQVSRRNGGLVETSDSTSQTAYLKRSLSQSDLLLVDDATVSTHASELLAKYKDPALIITSITLDGADDNAQIQMLVREIGDRITIKRRPPGGGSVISQDSYIQKIEITARAGETWKARFVVTPR